MILTIKRILLSALIFSNVFSSVVLAKGHGVKNHTTLSRAVGQMMMVGFNGYNVNANSPIVKEIKQYHIGGVILNSHQLLNSKSATNIKNPTQLKQLIKQLQFYAKKYNEYPLFIAANQEGGRINALKASQGFNNTDDPSQFELGKTQNQAMIFKKTFERGILLKSVGINMDMAPVADLNVNPNNPAIGKLGRSFGRDPQKVTQDLQSAIRAYKKANIYCTLKHFPGLGSANKNTDFGNADVTKTWKEIELSPYKKLILSNSSCPFIMVANLVNQRLDRLPASLSKRVVTDLLINKLHYTGLVITDDMDAKAIRNNFKAETAIEKAVLAGNNIILYGGSQGFNPDEDAKLLFNTLLRLANKNPEIHNQILKSYEKVTKFKTRHLKSTWMIK